MSEGAQSLLNFLADGKRQPTPMIQREGFRVGLSVKSIAKALVELVELGYVSKEKMGTAKTSPIFYQITYDGREYLGLPRVLLSET